MTDTPQSEDPANPGADAKEFASVLIAHAKGRAHDEATKLLAEAVAAVHDTGKSATVTVTLSIAPVKNNDTVVAITDRVAAKIPTSKKASMWFSDSDGGLHRNDPTQYRLDYTDADRNHTPNRKD
ncbi:hypothetical protein OG579_16995 [Williamsia herbipolensis]|uniref:Uncharacterized protein n=1 Tax=Williamsia herbipolensis TaxID=1603258 RepID=A0AAU4K017_9NOCA|nr:hypothetical protein [Williamsia herbipolensis]